MAESRINAENYINIQGWMITDLNLKGNELLIYACIYGFSQAENQTFSGSLQYLADWCNSTKQGVIKCLKSLVEKGYIVKKENTINNVKFCEYYSTKFNGGIKQSLPNNIDNNNINNKERKKESVCETISTKSSYDTIINENIKDDEVKKSIYDFIKMRKLIKKPMTDRALSLLINKLHKMANDKETAIKILEQSIVHSWQDIYDLKADYKSTTTNSFKTRTYDKEELNKEFDNDLDDALNRIGGLLWKNK